MTIDEAAYVVKRAKHLEPRIRCDISNVPDSEDFHRFEVALWFPGPGSAETVEEYPVIGLRAILERVKGSPV